MINATALDAEGGDSNNVEAAIAVETERVHFMREIAHEADSAASSGPRESTCFWHGRVASVSLPDDQAFYPEINLIPQPYVAMTTQAAQRVRINVRLVGYKCHDCRSVGWLLLGLMLGRIIVLYLRY